MKSIYILAIESSCDDTAIAISKDDEIIANGVSTQKIHENYGGVVPEWASRKHQENIIPVVQHVLNLAKISLTDLDAIAFTRGPGLLGSLIVGVSFGKALALSLGIPLIEVHHMKAHVMSHFIEKPYPTFPFICLTVSGGHTQIVKVIAPNEMNVLGTTIDDAAGEAFDKAGKMLELPYPAGPFIDKLAAGGNPIFEFTQPKVEGYDFSFSGLKTAFRYFLRDRLKEDADFISNNLNDICASFQFSIVQFLLYKLKLAANQEEITEIGIAGGVSANSGLRNELVKLGKKENWNIYLPKFQYCTDNAAMIAISAYYKFQKKEFITHEVGPEARLQW